MISLFFKRSLRQLFDQQVYLYLYVIARLMEYIRKMTSIFHAPIKWKVNYRITILMSHASL